MSVTPVYLIAILAAIWGAVWAAILQFTRRGQWLAQRRTWLTVVIGLGVDILLLAALFPFDIWWKIVCVIGASSIGIIIRSLHNEQLDEDATLEAACPPIQNPSSAVNPSSSAPEETPRL